jgi:hypothetical protein
MNTLSRIGLWLGRIVLLFATFLFTMLGFTGVFDPVNSSHELGLSFISQGGITVGRVALGGFPLATAIVILLCLVSARRFFYGLLFFLIVIGVLTIVRIYGLAVDGVTPWNVRVLKPELVLTILTAVSIFFEFRRRKKVNSVSW